MVDAHVRSDPFFVIFEIIDEYLARSNLELVRDGPGRANTMDNHAVERGTHGFVDTKSHCANDARLESHLHDFGSLCTIPNTLKECSHASAIGKAVGGLVDSVLQRATMRGYV